MNTVSLTNSGLIPMEAVTTMGVSAKEGDTPIGFFGTGLKYAIAGLLRLGHKITIHRGLDAFTFRTETHQIRGQDFDIVYMDGPDGSEKLGFTTHLGAKWEAWQIFRELYSNCLDEGGQISFNAVEPAEGQTTIHVRGEAFAEQARNRDRLFLASKPLAANALVEIHPGPSNGIYYRGVLAMVLPVQSALTYNILTSLDLTEDRTIKYPFMVDTYVSSALAKCENPEVIERVARSRGLYEANLSFVEPSDAFAETVLDLCAREGITAAVGGAVSAAEKVAQRKAAAQPVALSPREEEEMAEAKAFLKSIGYEITAPIIVTETLGAEVYGMVKDRTIYLSRITIARGGNFLIGTMLEEHLHIQHGFRDESRRFQDFLVDMVVKFARDAMHCQKTNALTPPPVPPAAPRVPTDDMPF